MYCRALAVATLVGVMAGCASSGVETTERSPEARLAAYAASTHYPSNLKTSSDLHLAVMMSRPNGTIRVVNFSERPVRDANVWINKSFVHHVESIPANGYVTLDRTDFYDGVGNNLSNLATAVNQVQVQSGQNLYDTMGPVYE